VADELSISTAFSYSKSGVADADAMGSKLQTVSGSGRVCGNMTLSTAAAAIDLGGLTAPLGWGWFRNLDASITIHLLTSTSGTVFASIPPGVAIPIPLGTGLTAPAAKSASGTPVLAYTIYAP
jgi:hypothetical protein